MQIDLNKEMYAHLVRLRTLCEEAELDGDTLSGRASAMSSFTKLLKDLVQTQETLYNLSNLQTLEKILIETALKYLSEDQISEMLNRLEDELNREYTEK